MSVSRMGQDQEENDNNLGEDGEWNVILWADHRAEEEAEIINSTGEGVLGFVGKTMSVCLHLCCGVWTGPVADIQLEMEIPKTLWLKKHMSPEKFKKAMLFE